MSKTMPNVRRAAPARPRRVKKPDFTTALRDDDDSSDDECSDAMALALRALRILRALARDARREKEALSGAWAAGIIGSPGDILTFRRKEEEEDGGRQFSLLLSLRSRCFRSCST